MHPFYMQEKYISTLVFFLIAHIYSFEKRLSTLSRTSIYVKRDLFLHEDNRVSHDISYTKMEIYATACDSVTDLSGNASCQSVSP